MIDNDNCGDVEAKPIRRSEIQLHRLGDETILYDPTRKRVHALNTTGGFIWQHLDGECSLENIAKAMSLEFDGVSNEKALLDVRNLIDNFQMEGLLQEKEDSE